MDASFLRWLGPRHQGNLGRLFTPSLERLEDRTAPAILYRVNAGGPALNGTTNWEQDTRAVPSSHSNVMSSESQIYTVSNPIDLTDPSVPAGAPMQLFQTERWDPPSGAEMQWDFSVAPGTYLVRLYFAEIYSGTQAFGARVFDVSIEGNLVLNHYDMFADVGGYKAVVKSFQVQSDADLNINFGHVVENPAIKGIEILTATPQPNRLGVTTSSLSFGNVALGSSATRTLTLTNLGGPGDPDIVVDATSISGASAAEFSDSFNDAANVTLAPGAS